MARGRGGKRTPEDPAPVSGPGALSQRTDGQPTRSFPAEFHGQRQALEGLQGAAPMADRSGGGPAGSGAPPSGGAGGPFPTGMLGPTRFPNEPVSAGVTEPQVIPRDPDALLRAIYQKYPHPDIARLLPPGG